MASIFTPTSNNLSGPWNINREDCIGDSLGYINANSNYFGLKINTLDTKIDNIFSTGMIMMWSGSIVNIPIGWDLCDGQNGTPDLRDRFIVGAGNTHAVGATGGADTVTLSTTQMPAHTHTGTVNSASLIGAFSTWNRAGDGPSGVFSDNGKRWNPQFSGGGGDNSQKGINFNGNHSHTMSIVNTGGGQAHENRPPYYALAFIIKV